MACGGLLGEDNDRPFTKELAKYGIEDRFVRVAGATRRNEMIVWPGGSMKLNRSAFPGLGSGTSGTGGIATVIDQVLSRLSQSSHLSYSSHESHASQHGVAILSGSLPPAVPKDFYARAVAAFKAQGWLTVLDASGEAMRLGLEAGPDLIKPNAEECEPLVGFVPKTPEEFARTTAMLREKAAHVVISDGGAGAWFDGEFIPAPKVEVVDTTAAGDTLLAEFCWRFWGNGERGMGNGERGMGNAGRWAVAAGSAACTMPGGAPPAQELVEQLYQDML